MHQKIIRQRDWTISDIDKSIDLNDGFGFGLEIINRIINRLGWRIETEQNAEQWRATIIFPDENIRG